MSILIDPPRWPAHGTLFSHLVSDSSLEELHEFASALGLRHRAFDRDHYDVPQERYDQLVQAGAREVTGSDLARALARSGLRVSARLRPERLNQALAKRWERTLPGHPEIVTDLLQRWSQEHRHYHDRVHLLAVLEALQWLCGAHISAEERQILELSAWFHDAIYQAEPSDEQASAELAVQSLQGLLPAAGVATVKRLILLTQTHTSQEDDLLGALLCDADLEVLARNGAGYLRYTRAVRAEYQQFSAAEFARGRSKILRELQAKPQLYHTMQARQRWETTARTNLATELELLAKDF